MWAFFSLALAGVVAATVALLRRYAAPSVPLVVKAATAYAWLVAFAVIALVPVDVFTTLTGRGASANNLGSALAAMAATAAAGDSPPPDPGPGPSPPPGGDGGGGGGGGGPAADASSLAALNVMWQVCFWSTQVLTWLALPFFQVYADAGDFTVGARCMTSLRENGILYGAAGAAGVVGLIGLVAVQKTLRPADLLALGMGLSNTFALSVGLLLMGYGLVEAPRELWRSAPQQLLGWFAHRTGRLAGEVARATTELDAVVTVVCANQQQMNRRDPLRPYMDVIAEHAEKESPVKPSQITRRALDMERLGADDLDYAYDLEGLAALRRRLAAAIHDYKAAHVQYEEAVLSALTLEEVLKSRVRGVYEAPPGALGAGTAWGAALWRYRCTIDPYVRKVVGLLLGVLSLIIVWSEATIITARHPDLSPFSLAIRHAVPDAWGVQLLAALPLAYVCFTTYFALFRVNAFDYNKLTPRATTGAALMQNGSLVCRFAPATAWNLLHMIHMDGKVGGQRTVFTKNMGTMDVLPFLGKHLNVYLPLLLVVHCALIYLGLWDRMLGACGRGKKYRFTTDDADDETTERGRDLLKREAAAMAAGMRVGDILHAPGGAAELTPAPQKQKHERKRSWFAFGRRADEDDEEGGGAGASSRAERAPLFGGMAQSADVERGGGGGGLTSSLVRNKHPSGSPLATEAGADFSSGGGGSGAGGGGGLDGLFAELSAPPARGGRGRSGRGGAGGGGTRD